MSTVVIKPKKSETASAVPSTSDLAVGEMAVNSTDQKIYVREADGTVVEIANKGVTETAATAKSVVMAIALG